MTTVKEKKVTPYKSPFLDYLSTKKLEKLAQHPINLSEPHVLTPERMAHYVGKSCSYKLLYATEKVTDEVMQALEALAKESNALDKMKQMQAGDIVNYIAHFPSENRAALHTATRDFFDHPQTAEAAREAAQAARQETEKLKVFLAKLEFEKKYDTLVTIAIGGSDLGPRAHYFALEHLLRPHHRVYFISNVDPDDAAAILKKVNLKRTLVVVISKSGTTLETATNEEFARAKFKAAGIDPKEHFIAITTPGTPMDNPEKYLECFYMWEWIGGRYSSTSLVGGLMLAFAFGYEVYWEFLRGAHAMDQAALHSDLNKNLPLLAALLGIWNRNFLHCSDLAIIPYAQALHRYAAHLQQLDMESNGKLIDQQGRFVDFQTGPAIWGEPGTNAQHSFFQLLHQGTATIPIFMIGFKKSQYGDDLAYEGTTSQEKLLSNLFAQSLALATGQQSDNPNQFFPGNRPTAILLGEQLTPFSLGALLAFYEHKVAFQGFIWGINSFDQEGVQLGKHLAQKIIDRFAVKHSKKQDKESYPLGEAYLKQLDHFDES